MKKQLLSLFLALALILSLAACTPDSADPPKPADSKPGLSNVCDHVDQDKNDYCDLCRGYVLVELDLFAINDLHGKLTDSSTQPGVEELSSYLNAQGDDILLIASGDMWQGSSPSNLTYGSLMTEWMNGMDFAAMTLGNHEFDWGESYIEANAQLAEFPLLAINIYDKETNNRVSYCKSSVLVERQGLKIGIIGAIGDCYSSISADKTGGIYFKTGSQLTALVKAESEALRSQGADIVIYSIHDGYDRSLTGDKTIASSQLADYYDISLSDGYVDLVLEGHTHQSYAFTDEKGICHLQNGGENRGISHAELYYNVATDDLTRVNAEFIANAVYENHPEHPIISQLLEKYKDQVSQGDKIVGTNSKNRNSSFLQSLVTQLYFETGTARWGSDYPIVLAGGKISIRNPYKLAAGQVRYSDLQSIFPFDNDLVLCSVKGRDLKAKFFESTADDYYIHYGEYGAQVRDDLDPNATYYIITDTYTSSYGPNRLTEVARYDSGVYARDLLADYIAAGGLQEGAIPDTYTLTSLQSARDICLAMTPGGTTEECYFIRGTVVEIKHSTYGNLLLRDENGVEFDVYGTYDATGQIRYDAMENPPQIGDTVILYGQLKHYVSKSGDVMPEMVEARLVEA